MNIQRIFSLQLLLCSALFLQEVHSFVTTDTALAGNATATFLHKRAGTWAIGSTVAAADDVILYVASLSSGTTATLTETSVTGIIEGEGEQTFESITALTVCDTSPVNDDNVRIVYVKSESPTVLHVTSNNGNTDSIADNVIKDADNDNCRAIVALASNELDTIMMAVSEDGGNWGDNDSGIALATLSNDADNTLEYVGQATGNTAALTLNATVDQVKGSATGAEPILITGNPALHWCKNLNVWYVGIQGATGNADGDAIKVLSAYTIEANNTITARALVNASHTQALNTGAAAAKSNIIGCTNTDVDPAARSYSILKIDSMLTSTGRDYLIVQGGLGTNAGAPSRQIFALPLVGKTGDFPGALAYVNPTDDHTVLFTGISTDFNSLYTEESVPAMVGQGPLPVAIGENVVTQMMVIGDAVYCSVSTQQEQDDANVSGLYCSQAEFDHRGQIVQWSVWTQVLPNEVSGESAENGSCSFFAVDAIEGKIWTIPTHDLTAVRVSQWEQPTATDTLVGSVNALLEGPCYSQLVLNKGTSNYAEQQKAQLTLFGGNNKVVAVRTGIATGNDTTSIVRPTTSWTATSPQAVDVSIGLENAGAINTFGATAQNSELTDNYVLAGTNSGLYAFVNTDTETGINANNNDDNFSTDLTPFNGTHSWKHVDAIGTDPVVKIVTMASNDAPVTFVLTHGARHKLWRLGSSGNLTLTALNATAALVWTADTLDNSAGLPCFFYDIVSIKAEDFQNGSTLLLATNTGLYKAANPIEDNGTAITFDALNLSNECNSITSLFTQNGGLDPQTLYYVRQALRQAPGGGWAPAVTSSLGQISFAVNPSTTDASEYYQALSGDRIARGNIPLGPSIKNFFTDGGRRFYIEQVEGDSKNGCTLHTVPFYSDAAHYNITEFDDLADSVVDSANTFYWVNNIGAGYLMAGTDNGVIALQ